MPLETKKAGNTVANKFNLNAAENEEIFYGLCHITRYCGGRISCGKFKNRTHLLQFFLMLAMVSLLMVSVIVPLILYNIAEEQINERVVIDSESSKGYDTWRTNAEGDGADDVQIYYWLYLFDVQNPQEILNGDQPRVVQLGPYAFDEYFYKFDVEWYDDGDTVTFNTYKYYVFNEKMTAPGLSLSDEVTLANPSVVGFQYMLQSIPHNASTLLDVAVNQKIIDSWEEFDSMMNSVISKIDHRPLLPTGIKERTEERVKELQKNVDDFFNRILEFAKHSTPATLLLKVLMCRAGIDSTPFWKIDPYHAWWGWLQDPLLLEVQKLLDVLEEATGVHTPWTTAVPWASTNYSSMEDTRRRRGPDTFKTGKKNVHQVRQYVKYQNMKTHWTCVSPMNSQDPHEYTEGEEYPACSIFDENWSEAEAVAAGYSKPFASDAANRIEGTDGAVFGRPVTSDKLQVYISNIYRSAYVGYVDDVKWHGVALRRYVLQAKDMYNSTTNPEAIDYYGFGPSGVINITQAIGVPIFVSFPHFLHGQDELVSAVTGLSPNEDDHTSYLDVEPQTGLLARVRNRLQVNYQLTSYALPSTRNDSVAEAHDLCLKLSDIIDTLHQFGIDTGNITHLSCEMALATELLTCLNQDSSWNFRNNELFLPYGWVEEGMDLPNSDAEDLSNSLYELDQLASIIRMWSLVAAGVCFAALLAIQYHSYMDRKHRLHKYGKLTPLLDHLLEIATDDTTRGRDHHINTENHMLRQQLFADILIAERKEMEEEELGQHLVRSGDRCHSTTHSFA